MSLHIFDAFGRSSGVRAAVFEPAGMRLVALLLLAGAVVGPEKASAGPPPDTLHPVIRTFAAGDYDGSNRLWAVAQDPRGLLYIAGQRYVRQFDGVRWRGLGTLGTTNSAPAQDLAVGPDGRIYVGVIGTLNVLRPDSTGQFRTEAISHAVPDTVTGSRESYAVAVTSDQVLVRTGTALWRVRGDTLRRAAPSVSARALVRTGDRLFVQRTGDGALMTVAPDEAPRVVLADARLEETRLVAVLSSPEAASGTSSSLDLIVTEDGLFRWEEGGALTRVRTALDARPAAPVVADAARLSDGTVALATQDLGILIVEPSTGVVHVINDSSGLPSNEISDLHVSPRGALWAATGVGLARISWPGPWTRIAPLSESLGLALAMAREGRSLYVGGRNGLYRFREGAVERVRGIDRSMIVFDAVTVAGTVLVTTPVGVYACRGSRARRITGWDAYGIARSSQDANVVHVGFGEGGVGRLRYDDGRWREDGVTRRVDGNGYTVAEDTSGDVWVGTGSSGLYRLTWPENGSPPATPVTVAHFDTSDGLPAPSFNFVSQIGQSVRALTLEGMYRLNPETGRFRPDSVFEAVYADSVLTGWPVVAPAADEVWIDFGGHKFGVARRRGDGPFSWTARPFRRLADFGDVDVIYPDGDSLLWVGTSEGVFRYDFRRPSPHEEPFHVLVRGVVINPDAPDNRLHRAYGGDISRPNGLRLSYADNTLRFTYGATSYEQVEGALYDRGGPLQFRYRLEGYDDRWSAWSTTAQKDYTGLPEGTYDFQVQARNLYNRVGRDATLRLTIAPPWYRTPWAYAGYVVGLLALMWGVVLVRTRYLRRRQKELEATVAERTEEVREQRDRLEQQAEQLKELDEAKSRFFANISHEFRTPLTLLLGPLEQLRDAANERDADEEQALIDRMERNLRRLRRLINQVLDLAELDAGALSMNARPLALADEVERLARAFVPMAERQQIELVIETEPTSEPDRPVVADPEQLEHVVGNLLSNALKFTPKGGRVAVRTWCTQEEGVIEVADTGSGIPPDQREAIFDRFEQGEDARLVEGSGIGLAYVKELIDLHGGTIEVESTEGEGTTFTVRLPRGTAPLSQEHLADASMDEEAPDADRSPVPPSVGSGLESDLGSEEVSVSDEADRDRTTVLIVDDNADVRQYVRSVLAPDFRVRTASDGEEGLAAAHEQLPDCILADVMMPEMDGVAMVEALQEDPATASIPVVMLTARAATEDELEGLGAGADDYVTKPFDPEVLQARVRGQIDLRRQLRRRVRKELQAGDGDGQPQGDGTPGPSGDSASGGPPQLVVPTPMDKETEFVASVREAIEDRLADPEFGVKALAEAVHVSRSTLYRRLKEQADAAPTAFIRQVRVQHGARLLREQEGTISEVAYAVGFNSLTYFTRSFRKYFGLTPSDYAEQSA